MGNGQWGNGQGKGNGQWAMGDGQWAMDKECRFRLRRGLVRDRWGDAPLGKRCLRFPATADLGFGVGSLCR